MIQLDSEHVRLLHAYALAETGGADGVRDESLIEAAVAAPYAGFGDTEFYPTIEAKGARLAFGLVRNHPFVDGNKRTAHVCYRAFLALNGTKLVASDEEKYIAMLGLAEGSLDEAEFAAWIRKHLVPADNAVHESTAGYQRKAAR